MNWTLTVETLGVASNCEYLLPMRSIQSLYNRVVLIDRAKVIDYTPGTLRNMWDTLYLTLLEGDYAVHRSATKGIALM